MLLVRGVAAGVVLLGGVGAGAGVGTCSGADVDARGEDAIAEIAWILCVAPSEKVTVRA
jgi:hypothetical protein